MIAIKKISLMFILVCWFSSNAQMGKYAKAKNEIENLIMTNIIRVDEKISNTVYNYLFPIEKVEIRLDTIIITAKATKYKATLKGEGKILSNYDIAKNKKYKVSIFSKDEEWSKQGRIKLGNFLFSEPSFQEGENIKKIYDDILIIRENFYSEKEKNLNSKKLDSLLIVFTKMVAKLQPINNEPSVSEEQRTYMLQAGVLYDQKQYSKVIELYEKAIVINPTSYSALYYNLGLVYALTENYQHAIFNMKKYLILDPNAEDSRSAKDKVIEWEININN